LQNKLQSCLFFEQLVTAVSNGHATKFGWDGLGMVWGWLKKALKGHGGWAAIGQQRSGHGGRTAATVTERHILLAHKKLRLQFILQTTVITLKTGRGRDVVTLLGSKYLERSKMCAEGIVNIITSDFAF
jgi:hypothetical protein